MELELTADAMRERVTAIALALPEATATSLTGQHSAFAVRGKKFAYFLVDHHGDGRLAINCKTVPGAASAMVADNPERYFNLAARAAAVFTERPE